MAGSSEQGSPDAAPTVCEPIGGANGVRALVDRAFADMADHMVDSAACDERHRVGSGSTVAGRDRG